MSALPPMPPGVVSDAVEALPTRLRRRLDDTVRMADSWPVERTADGCLVRVDAEIVVTVAAVVIGVSDLRCSCLLAPRCLHRAAVASLARTTDDETPAETSTKSDDDPAPPDDAGPVTPAEAAAADALWDAAAAVLLGGVPVAGAVHQAALLRAAHQARALRLPRAASAAVRVVEHLRAARREDPVFRLGELVADLRELLYVSHGLRCGLPLRGVARRAYLLAGNARLYGVCCEPVVAASGYAGAVTYLADASGRLWRVADVTPGGVDLAGHTPDSPVSVGEARLTYRQLGRAGLVTTDLQVSADGRISSGRAVRAVAADGVTWRQPPLDQLWQTPLREQMDRYHAALDQPVTERPAGYDLLFVDGHVVGSVRDGVLIGTGTDVPTVVTAVAGHDSPRLPYVDNLRLLADAVGAPVRLIGRPVGARRVAAVAVAGDWLPERYRGHVDLGIDRLERGDLPVTVNRPPVRFDQPVVVDAPPVHLLTRRVQRAVEGGRTAVPGDPVDGERLRNLAMPTAAALLESVETACRPTRDAFGRLIPTGRDELALAWLAAAVFLEAANRSAGREAWPADV